MKDEDRPLAYPHLSTSMIDNNIFASKAKNIIINQ